MKTFAANYYFDGYYLFPNTIVTIDEENDFLLDYRSYWNLQMPEQENMVFYNGVLLKKNAIQKFDHKELNEIFDCAKRVKMMDVDTKEIISDKGHPFFDMRLFLNFCSTFAISFSQKYQINLFDVAVKNTGLFLMENLELNSNPYQVRILDNSFIRDII